MKRQGAVSTAALAGLLGAVLGLREVEALLVELGERAAAFGQGPIPHVIDWIGQTAGARRGLVALDGLLVLAAWLIGALLAWRFLRLLNPGGTLLAPGFAPGGGLRAWLRAPLVRPLVRRSFAAALATAYLFGGVRALLQGDTPEPPPVAAWGLGALPFLWPAHPMLGLAIAFLVGGALLWLMWGRYLPEHGGGAVTPLQERCSDRWETVGRGLLVGAAALPVFLPLTLWGNLVIEGVLNGAGLASYRPWNACFWTLGLGLPAAFLALGWLGHGLAESLGDRGAMRRLAGPALAFILVLGAAEVVAYRAVAEARYDYGRELASLVGGNRQPSSAQAYLILTPTPAPFAGFVNSLTIQGIDAAPAGAHRTWAFLRRRQFQSVAAGDACVHLHDCASLWWDSTESLRVDLANLERNPQPIFGRLLVEKLSTCAPTPENRKLLGEAGDAARFHQSPFWMETLGLLYHRFGDRAKAVWCLGWAGLSAKQIEKSIGTGTALTSGVIRGRLSVNGRPGAGLKVGLLPAEHWQTLVGRPRPFELRWVAAATPTDAQGSFKLNSLGQGSFFLIVMGEPRQLPLRRFRARVESNPGLLRLDRTHPMRDLGTIRIQTIATPPGAQGESDAQTT